MAIGLGRLLGFHFPENFDQRYRSATSQNSVRAGFVTMCISRSAGTDVGVFVLFSICGSCFSFAGYGMVPGLHS
jgi:hypothetical protein